MKILLKWMVACFVLAIPIVILGCDKKEEKKTGRKFNGESICVLERNTGKIVKDVNMEKKRPPASLAKIMTTYVALQNIRNLSKTTYIDMESYQANVKANASMAGFLGGEMITYRDLLYGTMLPSGGECADSLAISIGKTKERYVTMMNQQAKRLELKNTKYVNPSGLDHDDQYTSAKDVAILLNKALKNIDFRTIITKSTYVTSKNSHHPKGLKMNSTVMEKLNKYEQKGYKILGGKSGTTSKAGLCWATLAEKSGKEYIVVVMGVPYTNIKNPGDGQIKDTLKILEEL